MVKIVKINSAKGLWELPLEWIWVKLGELLKLEYGKSLPASKRVSSGQYPVFGSGGQVGVHDSAITKSPAIIIGRKGSIGTIFFSESYCWAIDTTYYLDNFPPNIDPKYVYYYLKILSLDKLNRAAAIPGLSRDDIHAFAIPIPSAHNPTFSLNIQHRIVARVKALLAEVKESRSLLEEMRQQTNQIMDMVLEQLYAELEQCQVPVRPLGSLLSQKPQYGTSEKASENPPGTAILRMGNITKTGKISFNNLKYIRLSPSDEEKYLLQDGDILFNRTNSAELVGKSAVFEGNTRAIFASYLIRLTPDNDQVISKYLNAYINSTKGRAYIQSQLTRAIGQVNVNAQKIADLLVPLPNTQTQEMIVAYVDTIQKEVDAMLKVLSQDAKLLDTLEQSILERAFRGEL